MRYSSLAAAAVAGASLASGHTIFLQLEADGVTNPVGYGIRTPSYDGPITDVSSNDVACNGGPNPTTPSDKIINVKAGSTVNAIWRHTLTSGPGDVMDASHLGPTLAYLKKVDNAVSDKGYGSGWFKIQHDGYTNGVWGTSKVINNQGKQPIKIPDCLPDGQYLLRAEMIALHGASSSGGAQLYMECAQINISGGSATKTPTTYSLPGIYKSNDPGILVNIYSMGQNSQYVIPGPRPVQLLSKLRRRLPAPAPGFYDSGDVHQDRVKPHDADFPHWLHRRAVGSMWWLQFLWMHHLRQRAHLQEAERLLLPVPVRGVKVMIDVQV